jgi:hypothetical protein
MHSARILLSRSVTHLVHLVLRYYWLHTSMHVVNLGPIFYATSRTGFLLFKLQNEQKPRQLGIGFKQKLNQAHTSLHEILLKKMRKHSPIVLIIIHMADRIRKNVGLRSCLLFF